MPLWNIYHPESAFSSEDKQAIARRITSIYRDLPAFYVGVVFQPVAAASFYIAGQPADDFVRIAVDHIAQQIREEETKQKFLALVGKLLAPYVAERGLRWEMHVDETPFSLWSIQGMRPPVPGTPASDQWQADNQPSPY